MSDRGDDGAHVRGDVRWLSFEELAEARAIKVPAAIRLVQRRKWERHQANDGSARVAVPIAELRPSKPVAPVITLVAPDRQDAEALARERQRADQAEARADRAEAREAQARGEADQARQEREEARVRAAAAEGETKTLRDALDYARQPVWRRWLGML